MVSVIYTKKIYIYIYKLYKAPAHDATAVVYRVSFKSVHIHLEVDVQQGVVIKY